MEAGISPSSGCLNDIRLSGLDQYQGMRRNGKFYKTLILNGDEYRDSKYYSALWVEQVATELFNIDFRSELRFSVVNP